MTPARAYHASRASKLMAQEELAIEGRDRPLSLKIDNGDRRSQSYLDNSTSLVNESEESDIKFD